MSREQALDAALAAGRVAVVGGGITGLAGAGRLVELGAQVVLLERSPRLGGVLLTEHAGGFLIEAGADSFLSRKPEGGELCRRVGLGEELLPTDPSNRGAFVLRRGRLHPLPEGLTGLVPTRLAPLARSSLLSPREKMRVLLEPLVPRRENGRDESLAGFFRRRFGSGASAALVEPLVRGIYGGDPQSLSLRATFPQLADLERRRRSLLLGLAREQRRGEPADRSRAPVAQSGFLSLRRGMGSLAEAVATSLPAGVARVGMGVAAASRPRRDEPFRLTTDDGGTFAVDAIVLALPAPAAARVVEGLDADLAAELRGIPHASSLTVTLGWDRERVRHPLRGQGFVVPEAEGGPLLACTWASSKFAGRAPAGAVLVRAFLSRPEELLGHGDAELAELATDALRPLLGLAGPPRVARVHRWREALPRYLLGHLDKVDAIERRAAAHPGLWLAGAAYRGLGISDCILSGEAAAESAARFLASRSLSARPARAEGAP